MGTVIKILAVIGALTIVLVLWATWRFRSELNHQHQVIRDDYQIVENADWFGKTGLDEATERELPHYLRREFGERLSRDTDALKANDLHYLGKFNENDQIAHYWEIPSKNKQEPTYYAYVMADNQNHATSMGWGDKNPPNIPHN